MSPEFIAKLAPETRRKLTVKELMDALRGLSSDSLTRLRAKIWIDQLLACDSSGRLQPEIIKLYTEGNREQEHHIQIGLPGKEVSILRVDYDLRGVFFHVFGEKLDALNPDEPFCSQVQDIVVAAVDNAVETARENAQFIAVASELLVRAKCPVEPINEQTTAGQVVRLLKARSTFADNVSIMTKVLFLCDERGLLTEDMVQIFTTEQGSYLHVLVGLYGHTTQVLMVHLGSWSLYHTTKTKGAGTDELDLNASLVAQMRPAVTNAIDWSIGKSREKCKESVQALSLLARVNEYNHAHRLQNS